MAVAHEGLASLVVDLHEVGDLLALTNSFVQLHNLVGGSQVTPSQSRRHHSPRSNKWCVDDELLALVLQMIVSLIGFGSGGKKNTTEMNEVENTPLEKRDKEHCEKTLGLKGKIYIENTPVKEGDQGSPNSGSTPVEMKIIE